MNKNFLLALLFLSICHPERALAQTQVSTASIFFETGQSALTDASRKTLDALAPTLLQAPDYQVDIEAFTDDRGTDEFNQRLAADRAASVQEYLAAKGLIAAKTAIQNWGERKAEGRTDLERQKSRRVDVAVNTFFFNDLEALRERLSANTEQTLKIQTGQEQRVTAAKGTLVVVPANAFVFEDGTAPTGEVELLIQEAYDPSDFVLHNLTTTSDGRILQTGGMVNISARSGGRALQLADGASLTVAIPNGGNFDPAMELFYSQQLENGLANWKPADQKFRKTLKPNRVELNIDPALGKRIAAINVPEYPKPALPVFVGQMPPEPKMPSAPYMPRPPKKPEWNRTQMMFGGGSGEMTRMSRKELKKAQKYFKEQMSLYERDSAKYVKLLDRYHQNVAGYEKAKLRYVEDHRNWESELQSRLQGIMLYQRELRLHLYSKALAKAIKSTAKTIQEYDTYSHLFWEVESTADNQVQLMLLGSGFSTDARKSAKEANNLYTSIIGTKIIDQYAGFQAANSRAYAALPSDTSHRVSERMLAATGIKAISDSLKNELREKTILQPNSEQQFATALNSYVATVSKLGWINCDRFYNDPAEKMEVRVNEAEDATLYAICNDIDAMLPFYRNSQGIYTAGGLPKGKKITLVAIKIKDGMPQFAKRDMKVGEPTLANLAYRSMPLRDLKEELKKLNI